MPSTCSTGLAAWTRSGQTNKSPLARFLTAKVLTAAAAALATGGVALAASTSALTGHSPAPVHSGVSHYSSTAQASPPTRLATAPGQTAAGSPSPDASVGRTTGGSTAALCRDLASRGGVTGPASSAVLTQALGAVLITLQPRSLARVLTGLQPTVQSRILGELPASMLATLPASVLATLPWGSGCGRNGPGAGERQKTAARR
jgi:hypothetical protein